MPRKRHKLPGHDDILRDAKAAIAAAARARRRLRRRTHVSDPTRQRRINEHLAALEAVMVPLRSASGKLAWHYVDELSENELQTVSRRVQYERRQLRRMLP